MSQVDRYRMIDTDAFRFVLMESKDSELETGWVDATLRQRMDQMQEDPTLRPELAQRLAAYFSGSDVDFSDIPTPDGPPFFQACWNACRAIKRGKTVSYAELAHRAGSSPAAARAAGQAMRRNPLPIIVPCHRVIGTTGNLHGFGGATSPESHELGVKQFLMEMEAAITCRPETPANLQTVG